jgi:2-polyprenyl-3-methyl-5-hydroxy-6-metoxy-1,4-benzoquinol methylase
MPTIRDEKSFIHLGSCPVCGSPDIAPWKKRTFDYLALRMEQVKITDSEYGKIWDLSRCGACGHAFADPSPSPDFIASLYGQVEDPSYEEESEGRGRNFLGVLRRLEKLQPRKGRLFDVGAATGILLRLARERGWDPAGVEPSRWAVEHAAASHGLAIIHGTLDAVPVNLGPFQAATMVDIIEHTPRPREAVAKARALLEDGGLLCLVTPDIHSAAARLAGKRWWHLRPGHLAYFSKESLSRLLRDAGFRIVERKRYAWTFSAHYLWTRLRPKAADRSGRAASFLKRIRIKLALGDSFEIYAKKEPFA